MSLLLRVELILLAALVAGIMVRSVNRNRLRVQYSLPWVFVAAGLLIVALFPGVAFWLCRVTGVETPSNLVYLCGIVILLLITFYQTVLISELSGRVTRLTQCISLELYERQEHPHADSEP